MALEIGGEIDRVDGRSLTYEQFVDRYMKPNLPVVLTGLTDTWQSRTDWVQKHDPTKPDLSFFSSLCSSSTVQVSTPWFHSFLFVPLWSSNISFSMSDVETGSV
jgi:hypothetical protein